MFFVRHLITLLNLISPVVGIVISIVQSRKLRAGVFKYVTPHFKTYNIESRDEPVVTQVIWMRWS